MAEWPGTNGAAQEEKSLALLGRAAGRSQVRAARRTRCVVGGDAGTGTHWPPSYGAAAPSCSGSAAALTLGSHAVPVYEIYKVGADPEWVDGLDLLARAHRIAAAVIPHYDNKEGGTHDTRFCYLGEERLRALEAGCPTTSACSASTSTPPP